jgi:squalene-hopene/tetraprenyl-beta-curcumene cyclase
MAGPSAADLRGPAQQAAARASAALLALQDPAGWWKGELESNVTMDAEDIFFREIIGVRREDETARSAAWIRAMQRPDCSWATYREGPADLSTTVEAYVALRLAGDPPDAGHMLRAAGLVRDLGGVEGARVFTHIWLAFLGLWPWAKTPAIPAELNLLPPWFPFNPYDFACWARQTIVALSIVAAHRPVHHVSFGIDELRTGRPHTPPLRLRSASGCLTVLDAVLRRVERLPVKPLRRIALDRAVAWVLARQEAGGGWGGIQPPWVYSLLALHAEGYAIDHPVMAAGIRGLNGFMVEKGDMRWLEACQSPVWDTALAVLALSEAGLAPGHPALVRAGRWLLTEEVTTRGDWAVRRPHLSPGGWAFEFANDTYPDIDDTAIVAMSLRRLIEAGQGGAATGPGAGERSARHDGERMRAAVRSGIEWVVGMASRDGGWAAFDADNTRKLCAALPFCDFGAVIDPPSADVTAHVVEMLAEDPGAHREAINRGLHWLLRAQEDDGSWFGRWGANHVYGTGAVVPALVKAGVPPQAPPIVRALMWLADHQNADGGWGEDLRSYRDPAWRGRGASTPSQTAWALFALMAAGDRGESAERGIRFLVETQRDDGTWDEPHFTATGFPGDFYIHYHLYRMVFPLMALGRWVGGAS